MKHIMVKYGSPYSVEDSVVFELEPKTTTRLHLDDIHTLRYYIKPTELCLINLPQTGIMNMVWIDKICYYSVLFK